MVWLLCATLLGATPEAFYDELEGPRSLAMGGAHRGIGTSNDTLYLNPAGMALARRFVVATQAGFGSELQRYGISAVDSQQGPVAGALGYTLDRGSDGKGPKLHRFYLGAAYPLSQKASFGFTTRFLRGEFTDDHGRKREISTQSGDLGLMFALGEGMFLGLSYNNFYKSDTPRLLPPTLGGGLGIMTGVVTLAADAQMNLRRSDRPWTYRAGGEYLLGGAFPIRVGYAREALDLGLLGLRREHVLSGGVGWVTQGASLELAYKQSTRKKSEPLLQAALSFSM